MSDYDKAQEIEAMAVQLFVKAHELMEQLKAQGLTLEDAKKIDRSIENTRAFLHDAEGRLNSSSLRMSLCMAYQYEARSLMYVICRKTADLGSPLTWEEIAKARRYSGWDAEALSVLDIARRSRDRRNERENDDTRKDRGFVKGYYTWQIWSYRSSDNSWTLVD